MNYGTSLSATHPTTYPLALEDIKAHLRIDHDEFDFLISSIHLPGAVSWAEGQTRRSVARKTYRWVLRDFPRGRIVLPMGKTDSVASIVYYSGGEPITMRGPTSGSPIGTDYQEDLNSDLGGVLMPRAGESWPAVDRDAISPVVITFASGWTDDDLPGDIKLGLLWYIGEALDVLGGADLPQNTNFEIKNMMISGWTLR